MEGADARADPDAVDYQPNDLTPISTLQRVLAAVCYWPTVAFTCLAGLVGLLELNLSRALNFVIVMAGFYATWKLSTWGWRFLTAGRFRTGLLVGALGWFYGPVYGVVFLALVAVGADCSAIVDEAAEHETFSAAGLFEHERPELGSQRSERFQACWNALTEPIGRSEMSEGIRVARSRGFAAKNAKHFARTAVYFTCERHGRRAIDDLGPYYNKTLRNLLKDEWKLKRTLTNDCEFLSFDPERDSNPRTPLDDLEEKRQKERVAKAICQLNPKYRKVIELRFDGLDNKQIARRLGISHAAARKRSSRAIQELGSLVHEN